MTLPHLRLPANQPVNHETEREVLAARQEGVRKALVAGGRWLNPGSVSECKFPQDTVLTYGAKNDGHTDDAAAFYANQRAVEMQQAAAMQQQHGQLLR